MVATRFMELRKRRGLMITLVLVTVGIPAVYLAIRLILHAVAPTTYGPAGGYDVYAAMVSGVLYVFGFIVAATLGATAGSADLSEGMFRHLVVTGRSRLALYLARIPAGLAIILPLVAVGFTIVCAVCVFAAPTRLEFSGVAVPSNLSSAGFDVWAADHADVVICNFAIQIEPSTPNAAVLNAAINTVQCGHGPGPGGTGASSHASPAQIKEAAVSIAGMNYSDYARHFLYPSNSLMIKSGLWLELEAVIGFVVGLGLGSLIGQRTVAVVLMIVLEVVLTPILSRARLPHLSNLQRGVVGLATAAPESGRVARAGRRRGIGRRWRQCRVATGVRHGRRLRHRGVARRLDGPRSMADGDSGRLIGPRRRLAVRWQAGRLATTGVERHTRCVTADRDETRNVDWSGRRNRTRVFSAWETDLAHVRGCRKPSPYLEILVWPPDSMLVWAVHGRSMGA